MQVRNIDEELLMRSVPFSIVQMVYCFGSYLCALNASHGSLSTSLVVRDEADSKLAILEYKRIDVGLELLHLAVERLQICGRLLSLFFVCQQLFFDSSLARR